MIRLLPFVLIVALTACQKKQGLVAGSGYVEVAGGKIWYNVIGRGDKTPLVMLHGGPGAPSYCFNPLRPLAADRPLIVFDQLGCGRSDRITDTTLMTIDHHIAQVKTLLSKLDIQEFYLLGHSWGSMLATDYYLKYPDGIKAMILASPCLDARRWVADADTLIAKLPDSVQLILRRNIQGIAQDSATLASAVSVYAAHYYERKRPVSPDVDSVYAQYGYSVYHHMWGHNEFYATGTLKNYDRTADLSRFKVPVLYTTGEFDAARVPTVQYYESLTPDAELVVISNAGHNTMHDNAAENLQAIDTFLDKLEER